MPVYRLYEKCELSISRVENVVRNFFHSVKRIL